MIQHGAESFGTSIYNYIGASKIPQTLSAGIKVEGAVLGHPSLLLHPGALANTYVALQKQNLFGGSPKRVAQQYVQFAHNPIAEVRSEYKTDPFVKQSIDQYAPLAHPERNWTQTALAVGLIVLPGAFSVGARAAYLANVARAARVYDSAGNLVTKTLVAEGSPAAKVALDAGHTLEPLSATEKAGLRVKVVNPRYTPPTAARVVTKMQRATPPKMPVTPRWAVDSAGNAVRVGVDIPKEVKGLPIEGPYEVGQVPLAFAKSGSHFIRNVIQRPIDAAIQHGLDKSFELKTGDTSLLTRYATRREQAAMAEAGRIQFNAGSVLGNQLINAAKDLGPDISKDEGKMAVFLRSANVTPEEMTRFWRQQAAGGINPERTSALADTTQALADKGVLRVGAHGMMEVNADAYPRLAAVDAMAKQAQDIREGVIDRYNLMTPEGREVRKSLVAEVIHSEHARSELTGARTGNAYISLKAKTPRTLGGYLRSYRGQAPRVQTFITGKHATGTSLAPGLIPEDPFETIASSLSEALRYMNTVQYRGRVARFGSRIRSRNDEVLVRDPNAPEYAPLPPAYAELNEQVEHGPADSLVNGIIRRVNEAIPGLTKDFSPDLNTPLKARAPTGYVWVPKSMLNDMTRIALPKSGVEKFFNALNSAVTQATVYLRPGHLGTRSLTNATTNLIQGSFAPLELRATAKTVQEMGGLESERAREWAASTGEGASQALPHEGASWFARGGKVRVPGTQKVLNLSAEAGARWWARHIDMPFRLNAVLSEMRDIGYTTIEQLDRVMAHIKNPELSGMSTAEKMRIDYALQRSNRASIMYDDISDTERKYLLRYIWFFPWIKGSTRYAFHVAAEHPLKAWNIVQASRQGKQEQEKAFPGGLPSYAFGLTPLTGGSSPLASNFSSFTPFGEVGTDVGMVRHPLDPDEGLLGQLNPALTGLTQGIGEAFAQKPTLKILEDAASAAFRPTPEFGAIHGAIFPPRPTQLYGSTPTGIHEPHLAAFVSQLLRALGGQGVPRPTRAQVAAKLHESETGKHHYVRVRG
jgi:hypothetical protein